VFLLSGFAALGNEIIWTRFLSLIIHNTVYTYTLTLGAILFGIVLGSFIVSLSAQLINRYAAIFGIISIITGIIVLCTLLLPAGFWSAVRDTQDLLTQTGIVITLLLLPSFLSGMAFPLAIRMLVSRPEFAGAGVGTMTAVNTAGGVLGSLITGFLLLPFLGLQTSILITTAMSTGIGCIAVVFLEKRMKPYIKVCVVMSAVILWFLLPFAMKTNLPADYLASKEKLIDFREGVSSYLAVVKNRYNIPVLEIDRLWQGEERKSHQIMAAHIPMILHRNPQKVLVVGVGVGQTPSRFLFYPVKQLDCVDIEKELFGLIRDYFNAEWLNDKRVAGIAEDGRSFISYTDRKYDVISLEIGQIFRPGCTSFYTREFYQAAKKQLNPEGLICQFVPIVFLQQREFLSVIRTFTEIFPQASLWYNRNEFLLIGSKDLQPVLTAQRLAVLQDNAKVNRDLHYFYWGGPKNRLYNTEVFSAGFLAGRKGLKRMTAQAHIYKDDTPLLEYTIARRTKQSGDDIASLLELILQNCDSPRLIYSHELSDSIIQVIKYVRKYNIRNITALNLYRSYIETNGVDMLQKAYAINPYNIDIAFDLGKAHAQNREYKKSESCFRQTVTIHPDHVEAHYNLGLMQLKQHKVDSALHHFRETIRLLPKHAQAHNAIGAILAQQGSLEEALTHFTLALKADPDNEKARRNGERIKEKLQSGQRPLNPP
jgi:spermidine synthase